MMAWTIIRSKVISRPLALWMRAISLTNSRLDVFEVTSQKQFQTDVEEAEGLVIVDFHAEWCAPCKQLGPVLEEVATEEKVGVAKVNIDNFTELSMQYKVSAVPTVVAISDGKAVDQFVGAQSKTFIQEFIRKHLRK